RSRDCTRTTSSWRARSTACSIGRLSSRLIGQPGTHLPPAAAARSPRFTTRMANPWSANRGSFARRLPKERKSAPRFKHGYAAANRAICEWAAATSRQRAPSLGFHAISSNDDRSGERNQALHRLHQLGACARPLRHADFPDGGDRARDRLRPQLRRTDRARYACFHRLWRVLVASRLAWRPLEPAQHDGGVLRRLRPFAGGGGARAEP